MQATKIHNSVFYKLRASTADSSEVSLVNDGNYYYSVSNDVDINYLFDYKKVFGYDTSLQSPINFNNNDVSVILSEEQVSVNQDPAAFTTFKTKLKDKIQFISLIGYAVDQNSLSKFSNKFTFNYLENKELENKKLHDDLVNIINTETNFPLYDEYVKQNLMDNVLRGGIPLVFNTLDGVRGYHIYSRKHGDLERDYNFFSIEPNITHKVMVILEMFYKIEEMIYISYQKLLIQT